MMSNDIVRIAYDDGTAAVIEWDGDEHVVEPSHAAAERDSKKRKYADDETYSDDSDYGDDDFDANSDGDAAGSLTGGESDDTRLTPVAAPSADSAKTKGGDDDYDDDDYDDVLFDDDESVDEPARGPHSATANWT